MKEQFAKEKRCELIAAAVLLVLGCVLRLWALGALPYGLNQDEASAGYEAFALLHSGIDRCGNSWPVLLVSWGSGQNVLMTYLAMPFVALLGLSALSIRLPNAICGCLTLFVFWRLARRCGGPRFGLLALGLLVLNPWHIMMSRWALESNLLPFFLLCGIWCTTLAPERHWALPCAAAAFGLSLYAYGTAFFFLPLFLICALLWMRRDLHPESLLLSLGIFFILALPIAVCQLLNVLGAEGMNVLGVSLPALTENRQAATSVFGGGGSAAAMDNFRSFLHILWHGTDDLIYNALPIRQGGIFYIFGLPTAVIGFVGSLLYRKDRREEGPMRIALVCGLLCAFFIRCNINRINMIWLPMIYFSALGCDDIVKSLRGWAALPLSVAVVCFALFLQGYVTQFRAPGNVNYFPGLGEAIVSAETLAGDDTIYITSRVNQPYIFALFYGQAAPEVFLDSVSYVNDSAAFRQVRRFEGFEFEDPARAAVLVLHRSEVGDRQILASCGSFAVCKGDP